MAVRHDCTNATGREMNRDDFLKRQNVATRSATHVNLLPSLYICAGGDCRISSPVLRRLIQRWFSMLTVVERFQKAEVVVRETLRENR